MLRVAKAVALCCCQSKFECWHLDHIRFTTPTSHSHGSLLPFITRLEAKRWGWMSSLHRTPDRVDQQLQQWEPPALLHLRGIIYMQHLFFELFETKIMECRWSFLRYSSQSFTANSLRLDYHRKLQVCTLLKNTDGSCTWRNDITKKKKSPGILRKYIVSSGAFWCFLLYIDISGQLHLKNKHVLMQHLWLIHTDYMCWCHHVKPPDAFDKVFL